jgi:hypothetical protein
MRRGKREREEQRERERLRSSKEPLGASGAWSRIKKIYPRILGKPGS